MNITQIKRQPDLFFTAWDVFKKQDKPSSSISGMFETL